MLASVDLVLVGLIVFIIFCVIITIQLLYYVGLFSKLAYYKPAAKQSSISQPVSVIVCARDEAQNLVKNLPGILVQDYNTTHEIIVVNDNSTDESKYIIDEFKKSFKNLNHIELTQEAKMIPGKKFPLSMGIKSAKYETLVLTDADCMPASEKWVEKIQEAYYPSTEIVLGYGAYNKKPGLLNKLIRFETLHTAMQYFSYALAGMPYMGVGRNLSYKREVFMRNKGFSSINMIPSGDDDLFINKVATKYNTSIVIDADSHTLSDPKTTWSEWIKQKYRHYTTNKYYKQKHRFLLGTYAACNATLYPFLAASIVLFNWYIPLAVLAAKYIVQGIIMYKCTRKLNEKDLFPLFIFFDIWIMFYNILLFPSILAKPKKQWS
jgi:cellulose synthase/poly-beta-1,6-N-acetylglucosamine synthase-like glycosyltransferase